MSWQAHLGPRSAISVRTIHKSASLFTRIARRLSDPEMYTRPETGERTMHEKNKAPVLVLESGTGVSNRSREAGRHDMKAGVRTWAEQKANILLVDDEPANLLALGAVLVDLGQTLVEARSGEEALRRLLEDNFAVVLLDVQMGGLDGFETARLIRGRDKTRHMPIIFLTAYDTDRPVIEKAYALGAVEFLVKPVVPVILKAKVAAFVELFQKTEQIKRQAEELRQLERRAAEEELRLSEERYRTVVERSLHGIVLQQDGVIQYANPAAARIFGFDDAAALVGLDWQMLVAPADRPGLKARIAALLRGETLPTNSELQVISRNGSRHWVEAAWCSIRWNHGPAVLSFLVDVTERKLSQERLRESEERFRSAFEHTNVAMTLTDMSHRFVRVNAAFVALFGYSRAELLGMSMADITHPDDLAESYLRREELLTDKTTSFAIEKRYLHKDGHMLWGLANVSLIRDAQGQPFQYAGQVQDITERKQAEEAIRQYTNQLVVANRELAEKNQENEMFVYSVSHDLRSPLVNLQGFSTELGLVREELRQLLAQHDLPDSLRSRALSSLDGMSESTQFIQTAVTRLSGIIDALLRLSRAGRVEYQWQKVELNPVITRIIDAMKVTIAERGVTLTVEELPAVWGDATAMERVFANLIGNALNYLDPGRPGLIEIGAEPGGPKPGGPGEGSEHSRTVFVKDNGLGIPEAHQNKIFQAFQRCHAEAAAGEGMGLTIVQRIVERHRGKVWVKSTEGAGSIFYVTLPLRP
jgi:PAS domain S-box-containing protein